MGITKVIAEGKGKRIYATDNPDEAVVYFKDEAIAFRGLKIGRIIGKGEINNLLCEYIFTLLQQKGVPNHFLRRINDRSMLVLRVDIIPVVIKVRNIVAGSLAQRIGYPEGTRLKNTVIEYCLKDPHLDDPLVNQTHITAMGIATAQELRTMEEISSKVNHILTDILSDINIELIDFKLEFGRFHGDVLLSDEISPDTCRFWDASTHEPLDIDRFRRDLGDAEGAYREVLHRMTGYVLKNSEEHAEEPGKQRFCFLGNPFPAPQGQRKTHAMTHGDFMRFFMSCQRLYSFCIFVRRGENCKILRRKKGVVEEH